MSDLLRILACSGSRVVFDYEGNKRTVSINGYSIDVSQYSIDESLEKALIEYLKRERNI